MKPRRRKPRFVTPGVERAIAAAPWLEAVDEGVTRSARLLADDLDRIDDLIASDPHMDLEERSTLFGRRAYLASVLLRHLQELQLTPVTRPEAVDDRDPIDEIRANVVAITRADGTSDRNTADG